MKYCTECGNKLTEQWVESIWEEVMDCRKCNLRHHTTFGDYMGGSVNNMRIYPIPPVNRVEECIKMIEAKLGEVNGRKLSPMIRLTRVEAKEIIELLEEGED